MIDFRPFVTLTLDVGFSLPGPSSKEFHTNQDLLRWLVAQAEGRQKRILCLSIQAARKSKSVSQSMQSQRYFLFISSHCVFFYAKLALKNIEFIF